MIKGEKKGKLFSETEWVKTLLGQELPSKYIAQLFMILCTPITIVCHKMNSNIKMDTI